MQDKNANLSGNKQYVVFTLENEDYGMDVFKIKTIERLIPITRVPKTPDYLIGVINLRGDIIPIIDLRKRFCLPEVEETEDTRIIIFSINDITLGLVVDVVEEVVNLTEERFDESTYEQNELRKTYIQNIGRYDDKIITILNLDKLVTATEDDLM